MRKRGSKKSREEKKINSVGGREGGGNGEFAATAGAVHMLKKRSKSLKKSGSGAGSDRGEHMLKKGTSGRGSGKGSDAGSFSKHAGAVHLAKKRLKKEGSKKAPKVHAT